MCIRCVYHRNNGNQSYSYRTRKCDWCETLRWFTLANIFQMTACFIEVEKYKLNIQISFHLHKSPQHSPKMLWHRKDIGYFWNNVPSSWSTFSRKKHSFINLWNHFVKDNNQLIVCYIWAACVLNNKMFDQNMIILSLF